MWPRTLHKNKARAKRAKKNQEIECFVRGAPGGSASE